MELGTNLTTIIVALITLAGQVILLVLTLRNGRKVDTTTATIKAQGEILNTVALQTDGLTKELIKSEKKVSLAEGHIAGVAEEKQRGIDESQFGKL